MSELAPSPRIEFDADLRPLNTFGVPARAARLITLSDDEALGRALDACGPQGPELVLGGGSNLLFTRDIAGAVLRVATRGIRVLGDTGEDVIVEAAAGEPWEGLVRFSLDRGLYGLENLSLIPGSVGASPIQNIGAYGVELRDVFASLDAIDLRNGQAVAMDAADCRFGYRDSVFKQPGAGHWLVRAVRLRLTRRPRPRLDYAELARAIAGDPAGIPTPDRISEVVTRLRRAKLPDPTVLGNAGSFFKNPVVDGATARGLLSRHPEMPCYPTEHPDRVKLAAAWLIEQAGWRGAREGDAGVHRHHALVLVNHGRATGAQVLALAQRIGQSVLSQFGVQLEPEPRII